MGHERCGCSFFCGTDINTSPPGENLFCWVEGCIDGYSTGLRLFGLTFPCCLLNITLSNSSQIVGNG